MSLGSLETGNHVRQRYCFLDDFLRAFSAAAATGGDTERMAKIMQ
jgi:thiaminase